MNNLLTVEEVAQMLGIAKATVYTWASQRKLPSVSLSRKALRFREKDIQDFIDGRLLHPESQACTSSNKPIIQKKSASAKIMGFNGQIQRYIESARREVLGHA